MKELSVKLLSIVELAEPRLRAVNEVDSAERALSGGWSRR